MSDKVEKDKKFMHVEFTEDGNMEVSFNKIIPIEALDICNEISRKALDSIKAMAEKKKSNIVSPNLNDAMCKNKNAIDNKIKH
jgi:hypothetical protein